MKEIWARRSPEEKEVYLRNSFLSKGSLERGRCTREQESVKKQLVESLRRFYATSEGRAIIKAAWEKAAEVNRARQRSEEENTRRANSVRAFYASEASVGARQRISEASRRARLLESEETKQRRTESVRISHSTEEYKKRMSLLLKNYLVNLEGARKADYLRTLFKGNKEATEPELALEAFLNNKYPNRWLYNGNGNQNVTIGGRIPDFVEANGNRVIEVFGYYWHEESEVEQRIEHYGKYGYNCFVLWDFECDSQEALVNLTRWIGGG